MWLSTASRTASWPKSLWRSPVRAFVSGSTVTGNSSQEAQWGGITTTGILVAGGIEVWVKGARDLMHLKSYAVDGRLLRTVSPSMKH